MGLLRGVSVFVMPNIVYGYAALITIEIKKMDKNFKKSNTQETYIC